MKNKEIEELLNDMRHSYEIHEDIIKKYNNADKISYPYRISLKQVKLLLSYIEQLQTTANKCKQLENNRDEAIKFIKERMIVEQAFNLGKEDCKKVLDILKGDSDE